MEVKVYKRAEDGVDIASHAIPPYVGRSVTRDDVDMGDGVRVECGSETTADVDKVSDICDRFRFSPAKGGYLERTVTGPTGTHFTNYTKERRIIRPEEVPDIIRITLDGEQVWPKEVAVDAGRIEDIVSRIEAELEEENKSSR